MFATLYCYSTDLCPLQQNDYADEIDTAKGPTVRSSYNMNVLPKWV